MLEEMLLKLFNKKDEKIIFNKNQNEFINQRILRFIEDKNKNKNDETLFFLEDKGFPHIKLDLEIRNGTKKGWQIDLPFKEKNLLYPNVHVKTCCELWGGDYSWTFQFSNKNGIGGHDPIFNGPDDDLISFVYIPEMYNNVVIIKSILPWGIAKKYLKNPVLFKYHGIKKCIYFKDLLG